MNTMKLSIPGDYWDAMIHEGMLYLYQMDNSIIRYDIRALYCRDANTGNNIQSREWNISNRELSGWNRFDSPLKVLSVDMAGYKKSIYTLTEDGLYEILNPNEENNGRDIKFQKIWDQSLFSLSVKLNGRIALCGGEYGLFEYDIDQKFRRANENFFEKVEPKRGIFKILDDHSMFSTWAWSSIMNSSIGNKSSLVVFSWLSDNALSFSKVFNVNEIFRDTTESAVYWSAHDTIFRVANNRCVQYVCFNQSAIEKRKNPFSSIHSIDLLEIKGRPIFAGGNNLLNVIECENALVLFTKDSQHVINIFEPVTRWRLFPGLNLYQTIATVVLENHVEIYFCSFSENEYSIDQRYGKVKRRQVT